MDLAKLTSVPMRRLRSTSRPTLSRLAWAAAALACLAAGRARAHAQGHGPAPGRNALWPNQPADFRTIADQPFDALDAGGWHSIWNDSGWTTLGRDSSAPFSPPGVAVIRYPPGFPGGIAPGTEYFDLPPLKHLYVGLWLKVSARWQGHDSNVNKIEFVFFAGGGDMPLVMYGHPGGPYELQVMPQLSTSDGTWLVPNIGHVPFTLGRWHRVEWLIAVGDSAIPDGSVRWWLDGRLIGAYDNVAFTGEPPDSYKLSPTWGGMGDVKRENDYYFVDHIHLAGR